MVSNEHKLYSPEEDPVLVELERVLEESERLLEQAKSGTFQAWCEQNGLDIDKVEAFLDQTVTPEIEAQARQQVEEEMARINHEVDAEARRLGLTQPGQGQQQIARRMRRPGMV